MQSFSARFKRAEAATKAAFSRADAAIASLPDATINPHRGLGALIVSAASNAAFDPSAESHRIGKLLQGEVGSALAEIDQAERDGKAFEAISDYLKGHRPLPDNIDTTLAAHAKQVKAASNAGLLDAAAVSADLDRYTTEAMVEIKRLKNTFVASTESAAKVVAAKAVLESYKRAGLTKSAAVAELRFARLKGIHNHRYDGRMPQPKGPRLPARIRRSAV
jgi:hypothetical protein